MYAAKARGGGRALFTDAMRSVAAGRLELERAMRRGLIAGEFVLHYQPIVALVDERVRATEALVRWHRDGTLVPPGAFIPLAEDAGFIVALGTWVLEEACRRAAAWRADAGDAAPLPVHVNVAARQLADPELVATVRRALADAGASPTDLALEITESGLIDGSSRPAAIVEAIMGMARGLGIGVVAEGVERPEQADALAAFGCALAQGFLFGRPVPEPGFVATVRTPSAARQLDRHPRAAQV